MGNHMQTKLKDLTLDEFTTILYEESTVLNAAKRIGVDRNSIYQFLKRNGIKDTKDYLKNIRFNTRFFKDIDTEEKAYWLGFLYADGCVFSSKNRISLGIHIKDFDHLEKLKKSLMSNGNILIHENVCVLNHHSNEMVNDLKRHGCGDRKSLQLKFPTMKSLLIKHFIRGYVDGDGCITNNCNGKVRLNILGTEDLLNSIQHIFNEQLDIPMRKLQTPSNIHSLEYNGNIQATKILKWLYDDATLFLERKYEKYKSFII